MKIYEIKPGAEKRSSKGVELRYAFNIRGITPGHLHIRKSTIDSWLTKNSGKLINAHFSDSNTIRLGFVKGIPVTFKYPSEYNDFYILPEIAGKMDFPKITILRLELE